MRAMDRVDQEQLFPLSEGSVTRGHRFMGRANRFRGDVRKYLFYPEGGDGLECAACEGGRGGLPLILQKVSG